MNWADPEEVRKYKREWQRKKHNRKPRGPKTFDVKAYRKRWYQENRDIVRARSSEWYEKNGHKLPRKTDRRWGKFLPPEERAARRKAAARRSRQKHPERVRHSNDVRRCRKMAAAGACSLRQWLWRIEFHGWRCVYCGLSLTRKTVTKDHQIPLIRGGSNWPANLVPACQSCNSRKNRKKPREFTLATLMLFIVEFEIVKKQAGGVQGSAYVNRRGRRVATISAASAHPKDILTVLNADITIPAGEVIEILSIRPGDGVGTEGNTLS